MWEKLLEFSKDLLNIKNQVKDNTTEIEQIRQDLNRLTKAVIHLKNNIDRDRDNNQRDREILVRDLQIKLQELELNLLRGNQSNLQRQQGVEETSTQRLEGNNEK